MEKKFLKNTPPKKPSKRNQNQKHNQNSSLFLLKTRHWSKYIPQQWLTGSFHHWTKPYTVPQALVSPKPEGLSRLRETPRNSSMELNPVVI